MEGDSQTLTTRLHEKMATGLCHWMTGLLPVLVSDVENFMSLVEEFMRVEVATVCAITQCVACLTYIDVALAHSNTEDEDDFDKGDVGQSCLQSP